MSERDKQVECEHGTGVATFVCTHLRDGVACGYHASESDPADPWPDAWCDRCEDARARAGGWNDASEEEVEISLICNHCYDEAKARNRRIPAPLISGELAVSEKRIEQLIHHSSHAVKALQDGASERFRLGSYERWDADYDSGVFTMSTGGRPRVAAELQLVGSFSKKSNSWLWSWANEQNEPHLFSEIVRLKALGEVRGIRQLLEPYHESVDETHCWELTSLACHLLGFEACYRAPMDHRYLFMLLKNLRWVS